MKNVIYCFYEKPVDWHKDYARITLERAKEYAESIGADFKVFDRNFYPPIVKEVDKFYKQKRYPHRQWLHFWRCTISSMFFHHEFLDSEYERMLVMDADVYISENAENIFEDRDIEDGISMIPLDGEYENNMKYDIDLFFNAKVDRCFYGPLVLSDRKTSSLLVDNFITDEEFFRAAESLWYVEEKRGSVVEKYEMENPDAPKIVTFMEEHLYSYLFHKNNIEANAIDRARWMGSGMYANKNDIPFNMYHFPGGTKELLFDKEHLDQLNSKRAGLGVDGAGFDPVNEIL
jgi:hypothetical protein